MTTTEDDDGVDLGKPVLLREPAGRVVVDDGEDETNRESSKQSSILCP